mgnify:CR=1 FL=1
MLARNCVADVIVVALVGERRDAHFYVCGPGPYMDVVEAALEELRAKKAGMAPDDYDAALEKLLLELAQIDRRVRSKS